MAHCEKPESPLPEPLKGSDLDSFAHFTVAVRMPRIARSVIEKNNFPAQVVARLEDLIAEIPFYPLRPLQDLDAPDTSAWNLDLEPYTGLNWLETPWLFCEPYMYRRILEAIGYFQPGPMQGFDPYQREKQSGLENSLGQIAALCERLEGWNREKAGTAGINPGVLSTLVHASLWGNQADLSMWPAGGNGPEHADMRQAEEHLLVDNTPAAIALLEETGFPLRRVDLLTDNAGYELVNDLALVDYLLESGSLETACLQVKPFPTYVSDATEADVTHTLEFLASSEHPAIAACGKRLRLFRESERLQINSSLFWTSPHAAWDMPSPVRQELAGADLLISKGDANYRRWLGDLHWPLSTPLDRVICYSPAPLLLLRALKSEVAAGLDDRQADRVFHDDSQWMTDGRWALIQFVNEE